MPRKSSVPQKTSTSCTNCRSKKRRCDGKQPCQLCVAKGAVCQYSGIDKRRQRPNNAYVEVLESANSKNEAIIKMLRKNINDHAAIIQILNSNYTSALKEHSDSSSPVEAVDSNNEFKHLVVSNGVTPMVLGPTSIYNDGMMVEKKQRNTQSPPSVKYDNLTPEQLQELNEFRIKYGYDNYRLFHFKESPSLNFPSIFRECTSLFFKWMYSSLFLFIHRETFLYFFLSNETNCEYVTTEIIYAISALGAKISPDPAIKSQADHFYKLAKKEVFGSSDYFIRESSVSKLQTLLCLALYDLGRAELTSSWLLSGLAFRTGFDFGFELDPKNWNTQDQSQGDNYTAAVFRDFPFEITQLRSRIYWGSYIVDRFICLVTGREPTLKLADVTIPNSQDIGDLTGIEDFIFYDVTSDKQYACRAFHCLKAVVELFTLSDDILKKVFSPNITAGATRLGVLEEFDLKLLQWKKTLSKELFWNKSILKRTAHNELYMSPRYTYFIIMLSINRPFVSMVALTPRVNIEAFKMPIQICEDVIDDIDIVIKSLKSQEERYQIFYPHILTVYALILAISVLLWLFKLAATIDEKTRILSKLNSFVTFLEKCSYIWALALKPVQIYKSRVQELEKGLDGEKNNTQSLNELVGSDAMEFPVADEFDDIFKAVFDESWNQQVTRLDLADALWDEFLYDRLS